MRVKSRRARRGGLPRRLLVVVRSKEDVIGSAERDDFNHGGNGGVHSAELAYMAFLVFHLGPADYSGRF